MKLRIVVSYVPRYRRGHLRHMVPPVTGIHLAALTPASWEVEVVHEQVRPVVVDDDVDVVAISFFSGFADRAYELADAYRARGVRVVLGGPHASYWPAEALRHADAVVTGEAESVWLEMLRDAERGRLRKTYRGEARPSRGYLHRGTICSKIASPCAAWCRPPAAVPSAAASARCRS